MTDQELVAVALKARENAYAPYSRFRVGAALECADGTVYTGINFENSPNRYTKISERTPRVTAVSEGRRALTRLAVAGDSGDPCWPCGACRQMLREFGADLRVLCADRNGRFRAFALDELLPHGFGAETME